MKLILLTVFKQLRDGLLDSYAKNVVTLMTEDPQFTPLKTQVAELKIRQEAYSTAMTNNVNGGRVATIEKNNCKSALLEQMTEVAQLVEILAKSDERVALAAGFDVLKASKSYDSLEAPIVQKIVNESTSGLVTVQLSKVDGATNFGIEMRIVIEGKPDAAWLNGKYTSARKTQIKGLESGKKYQFRFRTIGNGGLVSDWSSVEELLVS